MTAKRARRDRARRRVPEQCPRTPVVPVRLRRLDPTGYFDLAAGPSNRARINHSSEALMSTEYKTARRAAPVLVFAAAIALTGCASQSVNPGTAPTSPLQFGNPLKLTPKPTSAAITEADLMSRLYAFADDSMQGRRSGTPGGIKATDYLAAKRENNRNLLDNRWQRERSILGALALRRLVSGLDENDLDDQLFDTFAACTQVLRQEHAKPRRVQRRAGAEHPSRRRPAARCARRQGHRPGIAGRAGGGS